MKVVELRAEFLPGLGELIQEQHLPIPPGGRVSTAWIGSVLEGVTPWVMHYPELKQDSEAPLIRLATVNGQVRAAACFSEDIEWAVARPEAAGELARVLEEIKGLARDEGRRRVRWLGRGVLGAGWFGVPTGWPHVVKAMEVAGFAVTERWGCFTVELDALLHAEGPGGGLDDLTWRWENAPETGEWHLNAAMEGELAGECHVWDVPWVQGPDGETWADLEWVGVEVPFRQRGVATRLIREQAVRQQARGVKGFAACVETNNARMLALAKKLGFVREMDCLRMSAQL